MTKLLFSCLVVVVLSAACAQNDGSQPAAGGQPETAAANGQPSTAASANQSGNATSAPAASAGAASSSALTSSPASDPAKPQFREVTVPSGTSLSLKLTTAVASDTSKVEDLVRATVAKPIVVDGTTAVPAGAVAVGSVLEANQSGRVKGRASVVFRFNKLTVGNDVHEIASARIAREAAATKTKDAEKVGIGAGAGALIGAVAGGKKGAGVGALIGGGAGTGVVVATRGDEVRLPAGAAVTTTLQEPLTVQVPVP